MLSYIQWRSTNIWKKNILEDLEKGNLEYKTVGKFLADFKKEFKRGDDETIKVAELKRIEQENRTMEVFVQKFRRTTTRSDYKKRPLVKEFKRGMNSIIRRKLVEVERPPKSIEQWYEIATNLDRH